MNPGTVLGQSIAAGILLTGTAVLGQPLPAAALAAAGLLWALFLNRRYARNLGARGRTARRKEGDRAIAQQLSISYVAPLVVACGLLSTGLDGKTELGPFSAAEIQAIVTSSAAMLVVWLGSSHTDWYFIRPRIDGVFGDPPCQSSRDTQWKGITRKWYMHRTIATLASMLWAIGIALIVTVMLDREWPSAITELGGFAAIVSVALWLMRSEISSAGATSGAIRSPRYWLGDDLAYETDQWKRRGFVLHVAVPMTKLVRLRRKSGRPVSGEVPYEESANLLHVARIRPRKYPGCAGLDDCQQLNPECTLFKPLTDVGIKHRLIF